MNTKQQFENNSLKALETYANVHRGSGFKSMASTQLYEKTREVVLSYVKLSANKYEVLFCSPRAAQLYMQRLKREDYSILSDTQFGLKLGVSALMINKKKLPKEAIYAGGGTTRLIGNDWVLWGKSPEKYEAGSPAVLNVIMLGIAIQLAKQLGKQTVFEKEYKETSIPELFYSDAFSELKGLALLEAMHKCVIGTQKEVPTTQGKTNFINLDNSASTPSLTPVWETFLKALWQTEDHCAAMITEVKKICRQFLEAPASEYDCCFTLNTTEAVNIAAENLSLHQETGTETIVLCSSAEHSSNDLPWRIDGKQRVVHIKSSNEGFIPPEQLEEILKAYNTDKRFGNARIKLVTLTGASNVLGTCNDMAKLSSIVHKYHALLHLDAAQLVAHNHIDMQSWGVDFLSFSGHKIYAPFGVGVLMAKKEHIHFSPESWDEIKSFGEQNSAGIAALGKSLELFQRIGLSIIHTEEQKLTAYLLDNFPKHPKLRMYGIISSKHEQFNQKLGVVPFDIKDLSPRKFASKLNSIGGIGVRYGCHCAHIIVKQILGITPGLEKFQRLILRTFPTLELQGVVRVSIGIENTKEQLDAFIATLHSILNPKNSHQSASVSTIKKEQQRLIDQHVNEVFYNIGDVREAQKTSASSHTFA